MEKRQIHIHCKQQWDLQCNPIICIHYKKPNRSKRVFCIWRGGIQIGSFQITVQGIRINGIFTYWKGIFHVS